MPEGSCAGGALLACLLLSAVSFASDDAVSVDAVRSASAAWPSAYRGVHTGDIEFECLSSPTAGLQTRRFAFEGRCKTADDTEGCAYHDLRRLAPDEVRGVDQRGVIDHQVTFPGEEHLWAALAVDRPPGSRFCWVGGALVGRNPLAMTWSTPSGTKSRKNNFLLSEGGRIVVEGARVHNTHDAFLAAGEHAGFDIRHSWITWNRDDFFEGYLHDLRISDTLVDGTYTFISDPDGDCDAAKAAHDRVIVIENSLIRLQRQPGPYAAHTTRWHLDPRGGHNTLWKLDSCGWEDWPRFVLRGNVFLVEGPRTTRRELDRIDCRLALPGDCARPLDETLAECSDNLFLYTDYALWTDAGAEPGPVPRTGEAFHEPDNPSFLPNGRDCYQRLTDDPRHVGYADVRAIWNERRARWIERHTGMADTALHVARIPGVDHAPFPSGTSLVLENREGGTCLTSPPRGEPSMRRCDHSAEQHFTVESFDDGKLAGALLLRDAQGRLLRTPPPPRKGDAGVRDWPVLADGAGGEPPAFAERWYLLPLDEAESGGAEPLFAVESDVIGRSFLRADRDRIVVQALHANGVDTALPQVRFSGGGDATLHWRVQLGDVRNNLER